MEELSDFNIYRPKMTKRWQEAFAITEALLIKFKQPVEYTGSKFILVTLSNPEQVHPSVQERLVREYGLAFDFDRPDRIIEEFAKKDNIAYLKLMPAFMHYHLRTGNFLHGLGGGRHGTMGHWNENGHKLAAENILAFLKQKHLVTPGESRTKGTSI